MYASLADHIAIADAALRSLRGCLESVYLGKPVTTDDIAGGTSEAYP